jgi:hypothetical protein
LSRCFTRQYPNHLPYGLLYRHSSPRTNRTSAYELCLKYDFNTIVLVTPKSAVREEFATFLNQLQATQQLDWIVVNKCHIILNR